MGEQGRTGVKNTCGVSQPAVATSGGASQPAITTLSLSELNTRSAPLGAWDISVFQPELRTYTYKDKQRGTEKQGASFRCILVAVDDPHLYLSAQKAMRNDNMMPLETAKEQFKNYCRFRMSKVSLDPRAKQEFLHTPLKMVIDMAKTRCEPLLQAKDGEILQPHPKMTLRDCLELQQTQRFDLTALVEDVTTERSVSDTRKVCSIKLVDASGENGKTKEMTLSHFYDYPVPASAGATIHILREAVKNQQAVTFFAIQGKKSEGAYSISSSQDFFVVKAETPRAQSLEAAAATLLASPANQRDIINQQVFNHATYDNEPGKEILCKLLRLLSGKQAISCVDTTPTVWQVNWAEVAWPTENDILTKDGERLFFKTTLRDTTGSVEVAINEKSALALAGVANKDEFLSAKQEGKQLFPVMASCKVVRTTTAGASQPANFVNLTIVEAMDQPLEEPPTHATLSLVPLMQDLDDDTACILPAALHMVNSSPHYAFTVTVKTADEKEICMPCQKIMTVIVSTKASKPVALGDGFKLTTPDVRSLWDDGDSHPVYKLSSICTLDNLPAYRLDPPRGKEQYALVTITAKVEDTFVVEHVQLLDESRAEKAVQSLHKLLYLAMHVNVRDRKRTKEWSETFSPAIAKRCRILGRRPTAPSIAQP